MDNKFEFSNKKWTALSNLGKLSEKNLYIDSNTAFIKMGMIGGVYCYIDDISIRYENRIRLLKREDLLPKKL